MYYIIIVLWVIYITPRNFRTRSSAPQKTSGVLAEFTFWARFLCILRRIAILGYVVSLVVTRVYRCIDPQI